MTYKRTSSPISLPEMMQEAQAWWVDSVLETFESMWGGDYSPNFDYLYEGNKPIANVTKGAVWLEVHTTGLASSPGLYVNVFSAAPLDRVKLHHIGSVRVNFEDKLPREVASALVSKVDDLMGGRA